MDDEDVLTLISYLVKCVSDAGAINHVDSGERQCAVCNEVTSSTSRAYNPPARGLEQSACMLIACMLIRLHSSSIFPRIRSAQRGADFLFFSTETRLREKVSGDDRPDFERVKKKKKEETTTKLSPVFACASVQRRHRDGIERKEKAS